MSLGNRTEYHQLSLLDPLLARQWGKTLTAPDECFPQMKQFNTKQMPKTTPGYSVAVWEQEEQVGELHLGSYMVLGEFTDKRTRGFLWASASAQFLF